MSEIVSLRPRPSGRPVAETEPATGTAIDPVCGMTVATVESSLHLDHDGTPCVVLREWLPARLRRRPERVRDVVTTVAELLPDVEATARLLRGVGYLPDAGLSTALFCAARLPQPILLEGEAGVGKTEAAKSLATALDTPLVRLQCYEGIDAGEALYEWNYTRQLLAIRLAESRHDRLSDDDMFTEEYLIERPILRALRHPRAAAGGVARRRDRPRRRRVRGVPARGAGGVVGDDPRARHAACRPSTDRRADVEPHARPARRAQATLPLPLDRLPVSRPGDRDHPVARARGDRRRWRSKSPPRSPGCARSTCRSRLASPRRSRGSTPFGCSASTRSTPRPRRSRSGRR